jgi:hypothetical protein
MTDPHEAVPSLRVAAGLLVKSASAQLRRLTRRSRSSPAPVAVVVPEARPARRRIAWRHAATCLGLLVAIASGTALVVWWSWETLEDRRVQLGAEQDRGSAAAGTSLEGDLVRREDGAGPQAPGTAEGAGSAPLDRPAAQLPTSQATSVSVDGRIIAVVVVAAALTAGGAACWLVVRRYRRRALLPATASAKDPAHVWSYVPEVEEVEEELLEEDVDAGDTPPGVDLQSEDLVDAEAIEEQLDDGLLVEQRRPEQAGTYDGALSAVSDGEALPPSSSWSVEPAASAVSSSWPVLDSGPAGSSVGLAADATARQRIFDRRASRRIAYVQPAWMWWGEQNGPVTVQDLSATGLRCRLAGASGAEAAGAPSLGDLVRVYFPAGGSTVKAAARVQWKEHTTEGAMLGVEFVNLDPADLDRLREVVFAAE